MIGLGRVHAQAGDHQAAVARLRAAQALATEIGNPQLLASAEAALAEITGSRGRCRQGQSSQSSQQSLPACRPPARRI